MIPKPLVPRHPLDGIEARDETNSVASTERYEGITKLVPPWTDRARS